MYLRLFLIVMLLNSAALAEARDWRGDERPRSRPPAAESESGVSLDAAVARVERDTSGRVLSARSVFENGRRVHRIKVLTAAGRVRVISVDAGWR